MKQVQEAYIVAAVRTPVGKAPRGMFKNVRPDDMLAHVLRAAIAQVPGLDPHDIGDVVVGCAMPEGEQGMNVARIGVLLAGLPDSVPAVTINRFCSSGVQAISMAADRIRCGDDDVVIAAGTESMSMVPMMGNKIALNNDVFLHNENIAIAYGMGITAEKVAQQWQVTREQQDSFAAASHVLFGNHHLPGTGEFGELRLRIGPACLKCWWQRPFIGLAMPQYNERLVAKCVGSGDRNLILWRKLHYVDSITCITSNWP